MPQSTNTKWKEYSNRGTTVKGESSRKQRRRHAAVTPKEKESLCMYVCMCIGMCMLLISIVLFMLFRLLSGAAFSASENETRKGNAQQTSLDILIAFSLLPLWLPSSPHIISYTPQIT